MVKPFIKISNNDIRLIEQQSNITMTDQDRRNVVAFIQNTIAGFPLEAHCQKEPIHNLNNDTMNLREDVASDEGLASSLAGQFIINV